MVGLGKGKKDTTVYGGFLGSEWPSGIVRGMSMICSGEWSSSGACFLKILQHRTYMQMEEGMMGGGKVASF